MRSRADNRSESPGARVSTHIRGAIRNGRLRPGSRIPSENNLVQTLGVSRGTVRLALERLADQGLLQSRGRRGRFVAPAAGVGAGLMSRTVALLMEAPADTWAGAVTAVEAGAISEARRSGHHVIALSADRLGDDGVAQLLVDRPRGVAATGQILETADGLRALQRLQQAGIAVVVTGDERELEGYDRVGSNEEQGAYALTQWLAGTGCRRIVRLHAAPADRHFIRSRDRGHERALREAGVTHLPSTHIADLSIRQTTTEEALSVRARQIAGHLVEYFSSKHPPDALILSTSAEAEGAAQACRLFGCEPGREITLVGYGASGPHAPLSAVVDRRDAVIGEELVRLLNARVEGTLPPGPRQVTVSPEVVS